MADRELRNPENPLDPRNRRITILLPFTTPPGRFIERPQNRAAAEAGRPRHVVRRGALQPFAPLLLSKRGRSLLVVSESPTTGRRCKGFSAIFATRFDQLARQSGILHRRRPHARARNRREFDARDGLDHWRSADVAHADEEDTRHWPIPARIRSTRARSSAVSTPGGNGSGASRTAIANPCSSARSCSSDSLRSSGVRGSAAKRRRKPARYA